MCQRENLFCKIVLDNVDCFCLFLWKAQKQLIIAI